MSKNVTMNVRINSEVKKQAEEVLASMGITLSEAFNMLLHQINLKKELPFELNTKTKKDYTLADLKPSVLRDIARIESGMEKLHGPYSDLEQMWKDMDL